jgi:hypothetical protein
MGSKKDCHGPSFVRLGGLRRDLAMTGWAVVRIGFRIID